MKKTLKCVLNCIKQNRVNIRCEKRLFFSNPGTIRADLQAHELVSFTEHIGDSTKVLLQT